MPDARIVALYNRTLTRAQSLQAEFVIETVSDDFEALLDAVQPDFVDICTAVETHLPLVRIAAAHKLPILCQKPLSSCLSDSEELVAVCAARGVRLMANDNWRWQGWYRELKRLVDSDAIGTVWHARFVMRPGDGWGAEPYPLQPYFRDMERFVLIETGIHYLDTLRFLFGPIATLHCVVRRRNPRIRGEDAALVTLEFTNGATAVYDADRSAATEQVRPPVNGHVFIEGSAGNLRLAEDGSIHFAPRGGSETRHDYAIPPGYRGGSAIAAQRHFLECLGSGTAFETAGQDYLDIERAVEACYRSSIHRTVETLG